MRVRFPRWHNEKPAIEGSLTPLIAVMLIAALSAAVTLWMRSDRGASVETDGSSLSPSSGMPAIPSPHNEPSPKSCSNLGVSCGVEMIKTSRIPESIKVVSG